MRLQIFAIISSFTTIPFIFFFLLFWFNGVPFLSFLKQKQGGHAPVKVREIDLRGAASETKLRVGDVILEVLFRHDNAKNKLFFCWCF